MARKWRDKRVSVSGIKSRWANFPIGAANSWLKRIHRKMAFSCYPFGGFRYGNLLPKWSGFTNPGKNTFGGTKSTYLPDLIFSLTSSHQYFLYKKPTDMRKSFDGLQELIEGKLKINAKGLSQSLYFMQIDKAGEIIKQMLIIER